MGDTNKPQLCYFLDRRVKGTNKTPGTRCGVSDKQTNDFLSGGKVFFHVGPSCFSLEMPVSPPRWSGAGRKVPWDGVSCGLTLQSRQS